MRSKSQGPIGAAGSLIHRLICIQAFTVTVRYKVELSFSDQICSRLAKPAGWILTRITASADGSRPYRKLKGRDCRGQIAEFARTVMNKLPASTAGKMEAKRGVGI